MADIEHRNIPDSELHEPKGASTALVGQVYISDGAGSGSWQIPPSVDPTNISINRLIDAESVSVSQEPTGTGEANSIQVEFGPAIGTGSDKVQLLADGTLRFNQAGLYRIKVTLMYGRTGGAGVSELRFRVLVAGTQAGRTVGTKIDDADLGAVFTDETWLNIPAPVDITYELMRDSSGNDSGGLFQSVVTAGTAPNWNNTSCAALRVEEWV